MATAANESDCSTTEKKYSRKVEISETNVNEKGEHPASSQSNPSKFTTNLEAIKCKFVKLKINLEHEKPESNIKVTFHVMIGDCYIKDQTKVYIVFYEPIGDGKTAMLQMKPFHYSDDKFTYLCGTFYFDRKFNGKHLLYKYVVMQKDGKYRSEKFFKSKKKRRFLIFQSGHPSEMEKYDDCISIDKDDINSHYEGRSNAFTTMSLLVIRSKTISLKSKVEQVWKVYQSLFHQQKLFDTKTHDLSSFGENYLDKTNDKTPTNDNIFYFCSVEASQIDYFFVLINVVAALHSCGQEEFHNNIPLTMKIVLAFELFIDNVSEIRSAFTESNDEDTKNLFLNSLADLINSYILHVNAWKRSPPYLCIFPIVFLRALDSSSANEQKWMKSFGKLKNMIITSKQYEESMIKILEVIRKLSQKESKDIFLKEEYLSLSSGNLFIQLLFSDDAKHFPSTLLIEKLCQEVGKRNFDELERFASEIKSWIPLKTTLISSLNHSSNKEADTIFCSLKMCIDNDKSKQQLRQHDILDCFLTLLIEIEKLFERLTPQINMCVMDLLDSVITNLTIKHGTLDYVKVAKLWSRYINLLNGAKNRDYLEKLLQAMREEVRQWHAKSCAEKIATCINLLNKEVVEVLFKSLFDKDLRNILDGIDWLQKMKTMKSGNENHGLVLNYIVLYQYEFLETSDDNANKAFLLTTDSDKFCKLLTEVGTHQEHMSEQSINVLTSVKDNLNRFKFLLTNGNISLNILREIKSTERYSRLIQIFELFDDDISKIVKLRLEEFDHYTHKVECVNKFFTYMNVETRSQLRTSIQLSETETKLKTCCSCRIENNDELKCKLCGNAESDRIIKFTNHMQSDCFRSFFEMTKQDSQQNFPDTDSALCFITKAMKKFSQFRVNLSKGDVCLSDVKRYFSKYKSDEIKTELDKIASQMSSELWTPRIDKQIQLYFTLIDLCEKAKAVCETVHIIDVKCDTSILERIVACSNDSAMKEFNLNHLNDDVLTYQERLSSWTEVLFEAIKTFNKCKELVCWIRQNIESPEQLKFFVEMATISTGLSTKEIKSVLDFQVAVMAYSGLLFDCKDDCDINKIFASYDTLKYNLSNAIQLDKTIADKLNDANKSIQWFQYIKDLHGSVEFSSLNQVNLIVKDGEFLVIASSSRTVNVEAKFYEHLPELGKCPRSLSLELLKELESKLMLVTVEPKIANTVERFSSIFHKVLAITHKLEELLCLNCPLFFHFSLTCYLSAESKVSVQLDFGHKTGILNSNGQLEDELSSIITCLTHCAGQWNVKIKEMRNRCHFLNYYTTNQLIALSQYLADLDNGYEYEESKLIMLLSLISTDIDMPSLKTVLERVPNDNDIVDESDDTNEELCEQCSDSVNIVNKVFHLFGCEMENIWACIYYNEGLSDYDDIYNWCEENADKKITNKDFCRMKKHPYYIRMQELDDESNAENYANDVDNLSFKSEIFDKVVKLYDECFSTSDGPKALNFISFKRLNAILKHLHKTFTKPIQRNLPPFIKAGNPNLIIVKESNLYHYVLMLYQTDDSKNPPSIDEILICEAATTIEQLHLHCQRAFNDKEGKIYSIIHCDRLNFNKSVYLEKMFLRSKHQNYRLIFFCDDERSDQSYIANAFHQYRVSLPELRSNEDLSSYLHLHLTIPKENLLTEKHPEQFRFQIVSSSRSGEGKTLVAKKISRGRTWRTLSIHERTIDNSELVSEFLQRSNNKSEIFHVNIQASSLRGEINNLLFSLAVMLGLRDASGEFWKCSKFNYLIVEMVMPSENLIKETFGTLLPVVWCKSPQESWEYYGQHPLKTKEDFHMSDEQICHYMDYETFQSSDCQRPAYYLDLWQQKMSMDCSTYKAPSSNLFKCLGIILNAYAIKNPSWSELFLFLKFLNVQLHCCENTPFCRKDLAGEHLPGFKTFATTFLIKMAKDISTRSAEVTDISLDFPVIAERRRWENNPHAYLFFNEDCKTFSFFGFKIQNCNLIDERSGNIIEENIISTTLFKRLIDQKIDFNRDLDALTPDKTREFYLEILKTAFNLKIISQCDESYELTSDNVLKMLAIQMRFRADIPVVIMGETGVGKTRLIRFMCDLQREGKSITNMTVVKCHGGLQKQQIYACVRKAISTADENIKKGVKQTVLFFDEANTTNAIPAIKEVMCDKVLPDGPIPNDIGLKFVAAINPYREHSDTMVKKFENAGLGYHLTAENTDEVLAGRIPMRRLVYRVNPIPESMASLIWDFGKLDDATEGKYIRQIVNNRIRKEGWSDSSNVDDALLVSVLAKCQQIMRKKQDECSFVSLRDVNCCLDILSWFSKKGKLITDPINRELQSRVDDFIIQVILSVACSYYVRLEDRRGFFKDLKDSFPQSLSNDESVFLKIIDTCQNYFIREAELKQDVCPNGALKENFWIMTICIELKLPLFLIGKPGTSKSLAKTQIASIMQGAASRSSLFKHFKEIQIVSFQCSPITTADGVISTFKQCQAFQKTRNLQNFTAVVVLDEIGLAEDSSKLPLKVLHPLLENGCLDDDSPEEYKRVGFIGISNWALDPAKMNRGIFISRGKLSKNDLLQTASHLFPLHRGVSDVEKYLEDIVDAYLHLCEYQEREYYGLRDFYSLVKMMSHSYDATQRQICHEDLICSIYRCFSGSMSGMETARQFVSDIESIPNEAKEQYNNPKPFDIVRKALQEKYENRYLIC